MYAPFSFGMVQRVLMIIYIWIRNARVALIKNLVGFAQIIIYMKDNSRRIKVINLLHFEMICKKLQKFANWLYIELLLADLLSWQLGIVVRAVNCHPGGPSSIPCQIKLFFQKNFCSDSRVRAEKRHEAEIECICDVISHKG